MQHFKPCLGKTACAENETHCLTCGRTLATIARTRRLVDDLVALAVEEDYDNVDDFMAYISRRVGKKIKHLRQQSGSSATEDGGQGKQ